MTGAKVGYINISIEDAKAGVVTMMKRYLPRRVDSTRREEC
jgi:hypothetical protein